VIVPDVNLLVYAHDSTSRHHADARAWWDETLRSQVPVGLAWVAVLGFLRVTTNARVFENPTPVRDAIGVVRSWLAQPATQVLTPGERHSEILFGLLEELGTAGNLTTDAHLAALAIEYGAEIATNDTDFARFPGLRWFNPLKKPRVSSRPASHRRSI